MTALEVQWEYLERARKYAETRGLECVGESVGADVLHRWEEVLTGLETDPSSVADVVDWVAKERLLEGYRERHGLDWSDPRLAAVTDPPETTRAYFRGRCLQKWPESIVAANWDSLVFDVGGDPLRRVPMMEPSRGTAAHVGTLISECESAAELLARLGS